MSSPANAAMAFQALHDQLKVSAEAGDMAGIAATTDQIDQALDTLDGNHEKWRTSPDVQSYSVTAQEQTDELATQLNNLDVKASTARGDLISTITGLVTSLLTTLLGLVQSLLGGGLPVALPGLPGGAPGAPGAPALPGLPLPLPG